MSDPIEIRKGPSFLSPHDLIKEKPVTGGDTLINQLHSIVKGKDPVSRMDAFVDSLYGNFQHNIDVDTKLTVDEFSKFEILYNQDIKKQILDGSADSNTIQMVMDLSVEFYHLVNIHRPIHIVDAITGEDVCPPLPPLYNSLRTLRGKGSEAIDIFHNAFDRSDGVKGGMGEHMVNKATVNLVNMLVKAQDQEQLIENINRTDELAENFHRQVFGKSVFEKGETASKKASEGSTPADASNPDTFMEFG